MLLILYIVIYYNNITKDTITNSFQVYSQSFYDQRRESDSHNIYSLTMNTRNRNIRLIRNVVADSKKMERSIEKLLRNHAANDIDKKDNFCINFINPNFNYIKCKFIIL